ncbi:MAG: patatin-like phospholipase family protein [archaeon]|nr:patatin-like phospholipase family protein [archaeon]
MEKEGITLVLSGGTARGLAHIGVIEVLEENNINIKRIIGVSAGALIGGMYAAGKLNSFKKEMFNLKSKMNILKFISFRPSNGALLDIKHFEQPIRKLIDGIKIETLPIGFVSLAYDLFNDRRFIFEEGELYNAVRASISIPGLFPPFKYNKSILIDGAFSDSLPIDIARELFPNDKIVAVNLESGSKITSKNYNLLNVLNFSINLQLKENAKSNEKSADLVITPDVVEGKWDFKHMKNIIREGRKSAKDALLEILKLVAAPNKIKVVDSDSISVAK